MRRYLTVNQQTNKAQSSASKTIKSRGQIVKINIFLFFFNLRIMYVIKLVLFKKYTKRVCLGQSHICLKKETHID